MNNSKNLILLFIVDGCEACKIAENLINKAIKQSNRTDVTLEVTNITDIHNDFTGIVKNYLINDCPTIVFEKNGKYIKTFVGTTTVYNIVNMINDCF